MIDQKVDANITSNNPIKEALLSREIPILRPESKGGGKYETTLPRGNFGFVNIQFPVAPTDIKMGPDYLPGNMPEIDVVVNIPTDARGVVFMGRFGRLEDQNHVQGCDNDNKYRKNVIVEMPKEPAKYPDFPDYREKRILVVEPVDQLGVSISTLTNPDDFKAVGVTSLEFLKRLQSHQYEMYDRNGFELTVGQVLEKAEKLIDQK